jgi:hypothetical protein
MEVDIDHSPRGRRFQGVFDRRDLETQQLRGGELREPELCIVTQRTRKGEFRIVSTENSANAQRAEN